MIAAWLHVGTCGLLGMFLFPGKRNIPQTPKEKSLVLTCSQIPFPVESLLPEGGGKNTGVSVRHAVPLAPLPLTCS